MNQKMTEQFASVIFLAREGVDFVIFLSSLYKRKCGGEGNLYICEKNNIFLNYVLK